VIFLSYSHNHLAKKRVFWYNICVSTLRIIFGGQIYFDLREYIATAPQDENTANLLAYLSELEKDVGAKKYGLVFEEHREEIDEVLSTHSPVLTEDGSLFIDNGGQMNFLIEGDNLASLQLLEKTHKGKIDLIYIDPPYNTGNRDFVYGDAFIDHTDTFRHSKWCSFISGRLMAAKRLLSDRGCIFISIDDNEYATLKCLCDSIFGEEQYIATAVWQKRTSPDARVRLSSGHEYLLVYSAKAIDTNIVFNQLPLDEEDAAGYKNPDNDPRGPWRSTDFGAQGWRPNQMYTIVTPGGKEYKPSDGRCWKNLESNYLKLLAEGRMWFGADGMGVPRKKVYLSEKEGKNIWTWWTNKEVGHTQEATQELKAIFGTKTIFDYPKPVRLIQRVLQIATQKDSTILDFFAGSGTTGHAVMKLNAEDGGTRRFILCTNNENNICREVTYERIKRVIDKEGYATSLKYFKVDYIPVSERMYYEYADELLTHIRELVELENGINFTGNAEVGIVLTEDELAKFIQNGEAFAKCRKLYMGHDLLPDEEQEKILRARGVEISIIPDYYYRDLQEG